MPTRCVSKPNVVNSLFFGVHAVCVEVKINTGQCYWPSTHAEYQV